MNFRTKTEATTFIDNCILRGRPDLAIQGRRALAEMHRPLRAGDPICENVPPMIALREELIREQRGKRLPAHHTRRKISRVGEVEALSYIVTRSDPQSLDQFIQAGVWDYTAEAIVTRFPSYFAPNVVSAAADRLRQRGLPH
jgi:hypothetical protein